MTSFDVPRNQVQQAGGSNEVIGSLVYFRTNVTKDLDNNEELFTVPVGKKSIVKNLTWFVSSFGNGTNIEMGFKQAIGGAFVQVGEDQAALDTNQTIAQDIVLAAGDRLGYGGNGDSTNGTVGFRCTIETFTA